MIYMDCLLTLFQNFIASICTKNMTPWNFLVFVGKQGFRQTVDNGTFAWAEAPGEDE